MFEVFEDSSIKSMALRNRFVRSATWEGLADKNGFATARLIALLGQLAKGGVGLIISSHSVVSPDGRTFPRKLEVFDPACLSGLCLMVEAVHKEGCAIALQIAHGGVKSNVKLTGSIPMGPSEYILNNGEKAREMNVQDIQRIVDDFAKAACVGVQAGFDAVQIHAGHGYLLSQFLSPYYNKRQDKYGGSATNRARILIEILHSIRSIVSDDYPLLVKINSQDFLNPGLTIEDMLEVTGLLEKSGVDAIELSGGTADSGFFHHARKGKIDSPEKEVFYREAARLYKEKIKVPLILVGGIRSFETAEGLIRDGLADYVSMSRPFICEPDLVNRWKTGDRRPSACLSDNLCYGPIRNGQGIRCEIRKSDIH